MESMEYVQIPLVGKHGEGKYTLVDGDYDGEYFSQYRWKLNPRTGYAESKIEGESVRLHKLVCKVPKGKWVDHINRDKLDNRSCNLRPVTPSENRINSKDINNKPLTPEQIRQRKLAYVRRPERVLYKSQYDKEHYKIVREEKLRKQRERYHSKKILVGN